MSWLAGIILGLVQGITEILPISSDGHIALLLQYWQLPDSVRLNLTAALHLGTSLAILIFMFGKVKIILRNLTAPQPDTRKDARKLILMIIVSSLPVVLAGISLEHTVEKILNRAWLISVLFLLNGTLLFLTRFSRAVQRRISVRIALLIGLIQATAIFPSISRSGTTISLALLFGVDATDAFEFSFLLALPVTFGASVFELLKIDFSLLSPGSVITGITVAGLVGYLMMNLLKKMVISRGFFWFGVYCWGVGLVSLLIFR